MVGEPRVVAIDPQADDAAAAGGASLAIPVEEQAEADWGPGVAEAAPPRRLGQALPGALAMLLLAGWTGLFLHADFASLRGGAPALWAQAAASWSGPATLITIVWLLVRQLGRGQTQRYVDMTRALGQASAELEARLTAANRELSLAREFLGAQSRDLDALGRRAVERISHQAEQLEALIRDNGNQIEAIGAVSTTALENMELLRNHLPVLANSAKDVANNIANSGRIAQAQLQELVSGLVRLNEFGVACERQVGVVGASVDRTIADLDGRLTEITTAIDRRTSGLSADAAGLSADVAAQQAAAMGEFEARNVRLQATIAATGHQLSEITGAIAAAEAELAAASARTTADIAHHQAAQQQLLAALSAAKAAAEADLAATSSRVVALVEEATRGEATIAARVQHTTAIIAETHASAASAESAIAGLTVASVRLLELIQASVDHSRNHLPQALAAGATSLAAVERRVNAVQGVVEAVTTQSHGLAQRLTAAKQTADEALAGLAGLHDSIAQRGAASQASIDHLREAIFAVQHDAEALAARAEGDLSAAIARLTTAARDTVSAIERDSAGGINRIVDRLTSETGAAIDRAIASHIGAVSGELEAASIQAAEVGRAAAKQLRDQLAKVNELADNLEQRVEQARERATEQVDNDFARRMAIITDALNSHAIDIAKVLDSEIEDTAWASYLRGDRGIFTRRAVRLLAPGEARELARLYQADSRFANTVNRYIHDFEAMLRQLLATRDGHALSVTMLSSDAGKLYVGLAQAIDRLRA